MAGRLLFASFMELQCPYCSATNNPSELRKIIVLAGRFYRRCDKENIQRFYCRSCSKSFSLAKFDFCYRHRKRSIHGEIFRNFVSGVSQRRMGYLIGVDRKTIVRKFRLLGGIARYANAVSLTQSPLVTELEFDDLETFEHSKLKPVSVIMAVESHSRRILGFRVASMPAKGLLVKRSLEKYGPRKDQRKEQREFLFKDIKPKLHPHAEVKSDENPHYVKDVMKHFPRCTHKRFKGRRGCVVGQGELKAGGFDPLFSLNHSFAMMRANVNRLFRRTWNTTKKISELALHLELYVFFHNQVLLARKQKTVVPLEIPSFS